MKPIHISAFAEGAEGGNPAGVWIGDRLPAPAEMQAIAAEIGYSETVFAMPANEGWKVRYYAPQGEVAFCGHATIALGAALGRQEGSGVFALALRDNQITVQARVDGENVQAALQSPSTWSKPLEATLTDQVLGHFGLKRDDLDLRLPPTLAFAGVRHAVLTLSDRAALAAMAYDFDEVRAVMSAHDLTTISLLHIEGPRAFSSRNAFASGGVIEDPATGAAAAALGGMLVDLDWDGLQAGGRFEIAQGVDMGMASRIGVDVSGTPGDSVRVSGAARWMS
ncbi:PhzF family phenazine biosynthesis protein [Sulfitobacter sp. SK012]|uniref:PhzF family phenazine biosynthesis protein n=1 Tax=Sulfitobacter sp. SK012 TaxID=1389005 RepID=UPI000E0B48A9|nr:PhzF family phenazine biosynthesis isomerase [Sulfitobacter sp. SK012]AXI48312.1 PhzF family phenazine biosynthesis protein [Sulfitobacter sp. SK012]